MPYSNMNQNQDISNSNLSENSSSDETISASASVINRSLISSQVETFSTSHNDPEDSKLEANPNLNKSNLIPDPLPDDLITENPVEFEPCNCVLGFSKNIV
eukprot:TRINITY_DN4441_c0_g1_i1.p1 TRINITY_DN4441_c0_g1~~TRINITY_DN4441_c0_g1_i1.p1  ORF type:complete len:101 (+),score=15.42 TRINITY_DN4441_c0_g1_i1:235-537(+)